LYDANTSLPIDTFTSDTSDIIINTPGTYSIKFKIKSEFGCLDSIEKLSLFTVHPKPTSTFTASDDSICITQCINFTNTSTDPEPNLSYHWYFDWPSKLLHSSLYSTNYCYFATGSFNVALIDSSTTSCVDTSILKVVNVSPDVIASFTASSKVLCGDSVVVNFTNLSSNYNGISYCWNFGDGASGCESAQLNPTHKYYLQPGASSNCYTVSLTVTNRSGCDSTIQDIICIYPKPHAAFAVTPTGNCNPLTVTFIDQSTTTGLSPIVNYYIKWGQGVDYNNANFPTGITNQYLHPGISSVYQDTITYIVTTQQGCKDTAATFVSSYPIPNACVAQDTIVCAGQQVNLGCFAFPNHSYNWYKPFGASYTPDRYNANPYIKPVIDTTYVMEVTNQYGCSNKDSVHVGIIPYIVPYAGRDTAICIGGSAILYAQGGSSYTWVNKKTQELITNASAFTVVPPFPSNFVYTATIVGTCNTDVIDVQVTVFPSPSIILNPEINDIVAGHPVRIPQVGASGGFYTYLWNPNYNIDSITSGSPTVWPEVTTTYQVILTDIHGCYDSAEVTVHVLCNASNAVYVPNAFLPDANGINGRFFLQGKGINQLNYLRIYDRWGGLVYSVENSPINNPSVGWDGTFNGAAMPSGVFMYQTEVQCAEGEVFPMTGTFTLIR
jgi:gliding motility-associated-like protein